MMDPKCRELLDAIKPYNPGSNTALIEQAFDFAKEHHGTQKRASGDPYYYHPVEVASILSEIHLDDNTIVTALLHDTVEDTEVTLEDIKKDFGPEIQHLVDGVTKLTQIEFQTENARQAENFRKLLIAISEDIRVLLVKLADRLHNMRTLHHIKKEDKRQRIAMETMEIYAPLAERIGMQKLKSELQDLAFAELRPEAYSSICNRLEFLRKTGKVAVNNIIKNLKQILKHSDIKATVEGREKTPNSIWRKMEKNNVSFEQLTDIIAFRVTVETVAECYQALGIIHSTYHNVPGSFKDYISTPKENGYRSLHTIVIGPNHQRIEIQIRTHKMHEIAEYGLAAHWSYKQEREFSTDGKQYRWIREMLSIIEQAHNPEEFMENTRLEMYHDQVFSFTPKGKLVVLPKGGTPVDFAFAVHSDVGRTCVGAKVNGRIVPLRTQLQNGDQVEIITSKSQNPSPSWERFVVTGKARSEVRRFIRSQERQEYITLGKAILERTMKSQHLEPDEANMQSLLVAFNKKESEDLYIDIGQGNITQNDIAKALGTQENNKEKRRLGLLEKLKGMKKTENSAAPAEKISIPIKGLIPGMAVHFASCCNPLPGDPIVGIVSTGKGVTIHTTDCSELDHFVDMPERWIDVSWEEDTGEGSYLGRFKALLAHQAGSLGVLANTIASDEGNINNLRITQRAADYFEITVDVEVKDVKHLATIMTDLRTKSEIISVERC